MSKKSQSHSLAVTAVKSSKANKRKKIEKATASSIPELPRKKKAKCPTKKSNKKSCEINPEAKLGMLKNLVNQSLVTLVCKFLTFFEIVVFLRLNKETHIIFNIYFRRIQKMVDRSGWELLPFESRLDRLEIPVFVPILPAGLLSVQMKTAALRNLGLPSALQVLILPSINLRLSIIQNCSSLRILYANSLIFDSKCRFPSNLESLFLNKLGQRKKFRILAPKSLCWLTLFEDGIDDFNDLPQSIQNVHVLDINKDCIIPDHIKQVSIGWSSRKISSRKIDKLFGVDIKNLDGVENVQELSCIVQKSLSYYPFFATIIFLKLLLHMNIRTLEIKFFDALKHAVCLIELSIIDLCKSGRPFYFDSKMLPPNLKILKLKDVTFNEKAFFASDLAIYKM